MTFNEDVWLAGLEDKVVEDRISAFVIVFLTVNFVFMLHSLSRKYIWK